MILNQPSDVTISVHARSTTLYYITLPVKQACTAFIQVTVLQLINENSYLVDCSLQLVLKISSSQFNSGNPRKLSQLFAVSVSILPFHSLQAPCLVYAVLSSD